MRQRGHGAAPSGTLVGLVTASRTDARVLVNPGGRSCLDTANPATAGARREPIASPALADAGASPVLDDLADDDVEGVVEAAALSAGLVAVCDSGDPPAEGGARCRHRDRGHT